MSSTYLHARLARVRGEEAGQTMIEYAGMTLLVSIVVIVLLTAMGLDLAELFNEVEDTLGLGTQNTMDTTPGTDDASAPSSVN
jgi:Flp pilus assembly pilin Flp